MLVTLGDLVEDVVVELGGPINLASDTDARITRRRGGSAANVAAVAARLSRSRFVGQVGDDAVGASLVDQLSADGVDVRFVRRAGSTATIVVLVDAAGERTMLVDRGSARDLDGADSLWLDDADALHVTVYSLLDEPIATTTRTLIAMARESGVPVSVDVSSVALIEEVGSVEVLAMLSELTPTVVFANADEADALGWPTRIGGAVLIVKRGGSSCLVYRPGDAAVEVPVQAVTEPVDTTGAGDAFAAGVLTNPGWWSDPVAACAAGHRAARTLLLQRLNNTPTARS